jgi:hypothetical protein
MMKDYLISQFIDDALDLEEKMEFVETLQAFPDFKDETIDLLRQEAVIRQPVVGQVPAIAVQTEPSWWGMLWRPIGIFATGMAAAMVIMLFGLPSHHQASVTHRFVLYQPDAGRVEIAGSFSGWKTLPMKRLGTSGYWETMIDLPEGDHRFSYIVEGHKRLADPTVLTRERDDFGGENSILEVKLQT